MDIKTDNSKVNINLLKRVDDLKKLNKELMLENIELRKELLLYKVN